MERKIILENLIKLSTDISSITKQLERYEWDTVIPLVILSKFDVINILKKFLQDKITSNILVEWANLIEMRDDIDFEDDMIVDIIFELANPEINGEITYERINYLLKEIS